MGLGSGVGKSPKGLAWLLVGNMNARRLLFLMSVSLGLDIVCDEFLPLVEVIY